MSLKAQAIILGNIHFHIVLFFWGIFLFVFLFFCFLILSPKYLMPFTETKHREIILFWNIFLKYGP